MTTTPLAKDHPDYQRTVSAAEIEVIDTNLVHGAGDVNHGRFYVGNMPYIYAFLSISAGGVRATFRWYSAQVGGNIIGERSVHSLAGIPARGALVNMTSWVEIITSVDAAGRTVVLRATQTLVPATSWPDPDNARLISYDLTVVAAGATRTDDALWAHWGRGYWSGFGEGTTDLHFRLFARDYLGVALLLAAGRTITTGMQSPLVIPPMPVRLLTRNVTAGDVTAYASVTVQPGPY